MIFRVVLVDKLRKPQRASHASGPATNNNDIGRHLRASYVAGRFAESEHDQGFKFLVSSEVAVYLWFARSESIRPFSSLRTSENCSHSFANSGSAMNPKSKAIST